MKVSTFLIGICLLFSFGSFAQPQQGRHVIGGSSSFNFTKSPTPVSNNYNLTFGISPMFGKFLTDNLLLEGGFGYSVAHYRTNNTTLLTRSTSHSISGIAEITRFFGVSDKFYITLGGFLNVGFGPSKTVNEIAGIVTTSNTYTVSSGLGLAPGLAFFLHENWMLYTKIGALGYSMIYYEGSGEMSHSVGYNFATNPFSLGFRYMF